MSIPACIFVAYLLVGALQGADAIVYEYHNITVDTQTPGGIYSPGFIDRGKYYNNLHVEWFLRVINPMTMDLIVFPEYIDLQECCDKVTVAIVLPIRDYSLTGRTITYTGQRQSVKGPNSLGKLTAQPILFSITGMIKIVFTSDRSVKHSGFVLRYYAVSRYKVIPAPVSTIEASSDMRQLTVHPRVQELRIKAPVNERILLQVVHMNLTLQILSYMYHTPCRVQSERIEIHDANCSMNDCALAYLCRHAYSFAPITLVSHSHEVIIRSTCRHTVPITDCAIINYKFYTTESGPGSCSGEDKTGRPYLMIDYPWILTHSYNANRGPSALQMIWWIENTSELGGDILITIMENRLHRTPDCIREKIELYTGKCLTPENFVTYFCGGVRETYKLTASRFAAIRFNAQPQRSTQKDRRFTFWIHVGPNAHDTPEHYTPDVDTSEQQQPSEVYNIVYNTSGDNYTGLYIVLISAGLILSAVSIYVRFNTAEGRSQQQQQQHQQQRPATTHRRPARKINPIIDNLFEQQPSRNIAAPLVPPPVPHVPSHTIMSETPYVGIPPPAVYDPPPEQLPIINPAYSPAATEAQLYSPI